MNWPAAIHRDIVLSETRKVLVFNYSITIDDTLPQEQQLLALQNLSADSFAFTLRIFFDNPDLNPQIDKPSWQAYGEYSLGLGFMYFVSRS